MFVPPRAGSVESSVLFWLGRNNQPPQDSVGIPSNLWAMCLTDGPVAVLLPQELIHPKRLPNSVCGKTVMDPARVFLWNVAGSPVPWSFFPMDEHLFAAFQFHPQWCGVHHSSR